MGEDEHEHDDEDDSTNPGLIHFKCMGGKKETRHRFHELTRKTGVFIGKFEDLAVGEGKRLALGSYGQSRIIAYSP